MKNITLIEFAPKLDTNVVNNSLTPSQAFKIVKDDMNKDYKRFDKLVFAYFRLNQHQFLYDTLKDSKGINKAIFSRIFCFEDSEKTKFASFLKQVFNMAYFGSDCKGLSVSKFTAMLKELVTINNNKPKKVTVKRFNENLESICNYDSSEYQYNASDYECDIESEPKIENIGNFNEDLSSSYQDGDKIERIFDTAKFELIFNAYIN